MRLITIAPEHMTQGSSVTYKMQSSSRHDPSFSLARSIAMISACVRGFWEVSRLLWARAMISSSYTMTAPIGTSPIASAFFASSMAALMNPSCILFTALSHDEFTVFVQVVHTFDDDVCTFQILLTACSAEHPACPQAFLIAEHRIGSVITDHHHVRNIVSVPFHERMKHADIRFTMRDVVTRHDIFDQWMEIEFLHEIFRTLTAVARHNHIFKSVILQFFEHFARAFDKFHTVQYIFQSRFIMFAHPGRRPGFIFLKMVLDHLTGAARKYGVRRNFPIDQSEFISELILDIMSLEFLCKRLDDPFSVRRPDFLIVQQRSIFIK